MATGIGARLVICAGRRKPVPMDGLRMHGCAAIGHSTDHWGCVPVSVMMGRHKTIQRAPVLVKGISGKRQAVWQARRTIGG